MRRKVIIITNPGEKTEENYSRGVYVDANDYMQFFKTPYGGNWDILEVKHLDQPSKSSFTKELSTLEECDFSIIIFCGHAAYSTKSQSNVLQLNKDEFIDSDVLRENAYKRIIILDCCREVLPELISDSLIKARMFSESIIGQQKLNPIECLKYYNKEIENCSPQLIVANAADIDETAGDNSSKGGYYSSSLLKTCRNWADENLNNIDLNKEYLIARFPFCHNDAIPLVEKISGGLQNPQIEKPRFSESKKYLPFLILA